MEQWLNTRGIVCCKACLKLWWWRNFICFLSVPLSELEKKKKKDLFLSHFTSLGDIGKRSKTSPCAPASHIRFVVILSNVAMCHVSDKMFPWASQRKHLHLLYEERVKGNRWNYMLWNPNSPWGCQECKESYSSYANWANGYTHKENAIDNSRCFLRIFFELLKL